ncbi:hypothetical protein UK23_14400 [Lentzea aerocolonigenes]|uniref:Gram-positive cocci surface proteins LPxTG domain-containing protein n=1 Tax=Lentzea aerocolonigenes TaxID=68170 RepID=A0A0F0H317_LENAE|nr:SdrD B-like domain-containing protein [Lentzea aerocolonigenes]KJK49271.1 hypothetical protein UK23_14400 [Lentzea aerocolonigenes]
MSFKIKAAAVTVATSLIAVPLALSGTAFAQDDLPAGSLGGRVFNDLNGDGTMQLQEPGIAYAGVLVTDPDGKTSLHRADNIGLFRVDHLKTGRYKVVYDDEVLANTTPTTRDVEVSDTGSSSIYFGFRGASICGTAWSDTNEDGLRQDGEPVLSGRRIRLDALDKFAETGADGRYCFGNLPAGDYGLSVPRTAGDQLVLTRPNGDSDFEWNSTKSYVFKVGKGEQLTGIDAGFVTLRADLKAGPITISGDGGLRVGETLDIYGALVANGNAPETLGGTLTLPEGLRIVEPMGSVGYGAVVRGQQVTLAHGLRQNPGIEETLGAKVVVEKEFSGGEIRWEVANENADSDPENNVQIWKNISAGPAKPQPQPQPGGGEPAPAAPEVKPVAKPEAEKVAALAYTGADPVATGAIGLGAMVLGGLALFGARRRRSA